MQNIVKSLIGVALAVGTSASAASAASLPLPILNFDPTTPVTVAPGDTIEISIVASGFSDGLGAGSVQFIYDPTIFEVTSVTPNPDPDLTFLSTGSELAPGVYGNIFFTDVTPETSLEIATITLTAIAPAPEGTALFFNPYQTVLFDGSFLKEKAAFGDVELVVTPLPAAVYLLGSALAGLVLVGRLRSRA